jgi:hypothetical protein
MKIETPRIKAGAVFAKLYKLGIGKTKARSNWRTYYLWAWQQYYRIKNPDWVLLCVKTQAAIEEETRAAIDKVVDGIRQFTVNQEVKEEVPDEAPSRWSDSLYGAVRGAEHGSIFSDEDDV